VEAILKAQGFDLTKEYFARLKGGFGHYIGLAVNDVIGGPTVLQPGMVLVNEPGFVSRSEMVGTSVEDTILITDSGCENVSAGLPRTVDEIETLMKKTGNPQPPKKSGLQ
jgi:Xaa-Pro aminopeptidase